MWLYTIHGGFSVVRSRQQPHEVMIRARRRKHLYNLRDAGLLPDTARILTTDRSDYRHRAIIAAADWPHIAAKLAAEVDYTNFKSTCEEHAGEGRLERSFVDGLHQIWAIGHRLQGRERR